MVKNGLLVAYGNCDGCQACVAACRRAHGSGAEQSGLKLSVAGPYRFPSGREETYFVATPTDYCDQCAGDRPACVRGCSKGCLTYGEIGQLGVRMNEKKMALFTLRE